VTFYYLTDACAIFAISFFYSFLVIFFFDVKSFWSKMFHSKVSAHWELKDFVLKLYMRVQWASWLSSGSKAHF
jgi:hypothetical protein